MDILIFRTSASGQQDVDAISDLLSDNSCINKWNIDMDDWEKVLRIECDNICAADIITLLKKVNIYASELL